MHKLTVDIIKHYEERKCLGYTITDKIIVSFLEECASQFHTSSDMKIEIRKILGLEPTIPFKVGPVDHLIGTKEIPQTPEPKGSGECADFKECPDCGVMFAHIQKKISLREKLADALSDELNNSRASGKKFYLALADAALNTINTHKEEGSNGS